MDQALVQLFPQYSRNRLQVWLKAGHILIDGAAGIGKQAVSGGERLVLRPPQPPAGAAPRAQRMPLSIVHEDRDLIVIDKPSGLVVHPGAGVPDRTLLNA
ncbi:MAG: RNA pseudouridine synthase, partial [Burkholderiales bacterium]